MVSHVGSTHDSWEESSISLTDAYLYCEKVTRDHSKSFYFASSFLPEEKRRAIRALYAFCRYSDDIVDEPECDFGYSFETWVRAVQDHSSIDHSSINHPVLAAWHDTYHRYELPTQVVNDLLAGMRMDLSISRYATFDELWLYCYRVASTVGLLSMHIIGYEPGADEYAIKLGVALQLTNILRDVGEDARRNRIYLPLDELADFGLSEQDILHGRLDERYKALIEYQITRAEKFYREAQPGIGMLHRTGQLAVAAAAEVYRGILPVIQSNDYDNHTRRAFVPNWKKLLMLPRIWLNVRF